MKYGEDLRCCGILVAIVLCNYHDHIRGILKGMRKTVIAGVKSNLFGFLRNLLHDIILAIVLLLIDIFDCYSALFAKLIKYNDTIESFAKVTESSAFIAILAILAITIIITAVLFWHYKLRLIFFDKHLNKQDKFLINLLVVSSLYLLLLAYAKMINSRSLILAGVIIMVLVAIYLIARIVTISTICNKNRRNNQQVLSLSELYRGNIVATPGKILLEDIESDEDIFDRTITIDKIASIVKGDLAGKSFAMSLVGSWGSGKSTILKCVKRKIEKEGKKDIIFVDDFQPWIYKDANKMVVEFGNALLDKIGYKKPFVSSKAIADAFLKTTANIDSTGILSRIKLPEVKENPIEIINNYLLGRNKKLVIVLDNLERCELGEIVRFLRIIKNHLQFNNSYYIFSYDDEVMCDGLVHNELDKMFLDKFSQCTIPVPEIPKEKKKEVIEKCFDNYYKIVGRERGNDYGQLLSVISSVIETPRELIHVINSAYVGGIDFLNQTDSILLNILKQNAPDIYSVIRNNKDKFVYSSSAYFDAVINMDHDKDGLKKYCESEAAFFKGLLEDKEKAKGFAKYKPIISHLFPGVNVFMDGHNNEVLFETGIISGRYEQSYGERRVCRDELFEPYFTQNKNRHVEICEKVDKILEQEPETIAEVIKSFADNLDSESVRDVLQHLKERISGLDIEKKDTLALNIFEIVLSLRGKVETKDRAILDWFMDYLAAALTVVSQSVFEKILLELKQDYRNLGVLNSLEKQMRNLDRRMMISGRFMPIHEALEGMKHGIIEQEINIYKKDTYSRFNIRMLDGDDAIIDYLKKIKNKVLKKYQILMLADFVYWGGSGGRNFYEVDDKIIKSVFSDEEILDIIKSAKSGRLKDAIKKIYSEATNEFVGFRQGDRTYCGPEMFDLFSLCDEYINS